MINFAPVEVLDFCVPTVHRKNAGHCGSTSPEDIFSIAIVAMSHFVLFRQLVGPCLWHLAELQISWRNVLEQLFSHKCRQLARLLRHLKVLGASLHAWRGSYCGLLERPWGKLEFLHFSQTTRRPQHQVQWNLHFQSNKLTTVVVHSWGNYMT